MVEINNICDKLKKSLGADTENTIHLDFVKKISWVLCLAALPKLVTHTSEKSKYDLIKKSIDKKSISSINPSIELLKSVIDTEKKFGPDIFNTETYLLYEYTFNMVNFSQVELADVLDLVLDGEGLTNVYEFRELVYDWIFNDVLEAAIQNKLPKKIYSLGMLFPSQEFLGTLI